MAGKRTATKVKKKLGTKGLRAQDLVETVEETPQTTVTPEPTTIETTIHGTAQIEIGGLPEVELPPPAPEKSDSTVEIPVIVDSSSESALLFECAWEVCWQLGGIYTVLKTKAKTMVDGWGERYCLIGPYNPQSAELEFEDQTPDRLMGEAIERVRKAGIGVRYGKWLVEGRPRTILIDHRSRYPHLDNDKYFIWKDHGIPTDAGDGEVNDVVAFGFAVAEFFKALTEVANGRPILAHFHEWMGGVAVPRIAHMRLPVATVFTTHATLLGRYLASDNPYFYDHLPYLDPDKEAARFNIYPRFAIERAAAHASTVFTTVSDVTSLEAEKLLGRIPDEILPNGLNISRFEAMHEFQNLHRQAKERIHEFVMGHFFPAYEFDIENTLYFFVGGRYEYRNKGLDMFIEAMTRLNWRLRSEANRPTIVAFIITKAMTRHINVGVLQTQTMFEELKQTCRLVQEGIGQVLLHASARGRFATPKEIFTEEMQIRLRRAMNAWRTRRQPPILTHDLVDDAGDPVLKHLRHRGLFNAAEDPVKIVYHPDFVTATSPLLHLDYIDFVRGCHMGIFPSYYEPWGYTPMESIALGVPAVTTDLSGFGAYVMSKPEEFAEQGVYIAKRRGRSFDDCCNDIVEYLYQFTRNDRRSRIEMRNRVERLGAKFDWSALIGHYDKAHAEALSRVGKSVGKVEVRVV